MKKTIKKTVNFTEEEWARLQDLCEFSGKSRHRLIGELIMKAQMALN